MPGREEYQEPGSENRKSSRLNSTGSSSSSRRFPQLYPGLPKYDSRFRPPSNRKHDERPESHGTIRYGSKLYTPRERRSRNLNLNGESSHPVRKLQLVGSITLAAIKSTHQTSNDKTRERVFGKEYANQFVNDYKASGSYSKAQTNAYSREHRLIESRFGPEAYDDVNNIRKLRKDEKFKEARGIVNKREFKWQMKIYDFEFADYFKTAREKYGWDQAMYCARKDYGNRKRRERRAIQGDSTPDSNNKDNFYDKPEFQDRGKYIDAQDASEPVNECNEFEYEGLGNDVESENESDTGITSDPKYDNDGRAGSVTESFRPPPKVNGSVSVGGSVNRMRR